MSPKSKQFYEFADFRLDVSEKILLRGEDLISLTPKVLKLFKYWLKMRDICLRKKS